MHAAPACILYLHAGTNIECTSVRCAEHTHLRVCVRLSLCVCALVCYIRDSRVSCCVTPHD